MPPDDDDTATRSPLRLRADLHWLAAPGGLGERWRVKDPVTLEYHEFGADERFLLEQFDGRTPLDAIRRRYDQRFRPRSIRAERLLAFASDAHARGLLLDAGRRQGKRAVQQASSGRRRAGVSRLFSLLFLRLPGFDPSGLLALLGPLTRWCWSPVTIAGALLAGLATLGLLVARAGDFASRLPASRDFLQGDNLLLLLAAFMVVKLVHELAHGLACRHVGARCHEMGVMLIALVPCPYCDVTDLWMVPGRGSRVLVSAAGMYAELAIAIAAAWLWAFAAEGAAAAVLLNVMVACGVSTLLFNANPLLKLDGYYLLSDLSGVANLQARSRQVLFGPAAAWFGARPPMRLGDQPSRWLVVYALLSLAYQAFVIAVIAWGVHTLLASAGLRPVGDVLVALTLVGIVTGPTLRLVATLRSPVRRRMIRWTRVAGAATASAAGLGALLLVPAPATVTAPAVFQARDARTVAAAAPGRLASILGEGRRVTAGQVVARLENPDLARRRVRLAGEAAAARSRLESLRRQAAADPGLLTRLPAAEAGAARAADDLRQLDEEIARLTLTAPCDGVVIGAAAREPRADATLPTWRGRLVDPENAGCWVAAGDAVCLVAPDPGRVQATAMVEAGKTRGVRPGLPVRLLAYQSPSAVVRAELAEVGRAQTEELPDAWKRHPDVLLRQRGAAAGRPLAPLLLARVDLPGGSRAIGHASHGRCKIELGSQPLGVLAWRWLARIFPLRF